MARQQLPNGSFARVPPHDRFWQKVDKDGPGGCWLWTGPMRKNGYGYTTDFWTKILAHRFSYFLAHGPIPQGMRVCHSCDVRNCVNPAHLWLGTAKDNNADARAKGRWTPPVVEPRRGETNPLAKLNAEQVRAIRRAYASNPPGVGKGKPITLQMLADRYGVNKTNISAIVNRKTWTHVD